MKHSLRVCWLYHDIMDLYGDKGNMMVLKKRCEDRDIDFVLDTCGIGEKKNLCDYNLIFLGGGDDKTQFSLIPDLLSRKENIKQAMDENTFVLLICGGYQLFGQYYTASDNQKIDGLKFYDYYTDTGADRTRCVGNIIIEANLDGIKTQIVGFENHGGQTKNVSKPLGKVLSGYGNTFDSGYEGFYDGKILGTYLHGPLLPKNPVVADFVIMKALQKDDPEFKFEDLKPLENPFDEVARDVLFKRLNVEKTR